MRVEEAEVAAMERMETTGGGGRGRGRGGMEGDAVILGMRLSRTIRKEKKRMLGSRNRT